MKSEKEEVFGLIDDTNSILNRLIGDFVKYHHSGKGHLEISKQSPKFVLTMRLDRKKGTK